MTEAVSPEQRVVGYVYNLVTTLADGQQLTISGNLAIDAEMAEMNAQFDKLIAVTNRLSAKSKIILKRGEIVADETVINAMTDDLAQLDEKYKGRKMSTVEESNRDGIVRNIRHLKSRIATRQDELAQLEKEAA